MTPQKSDSVLNITYKFILLDGTQRILNVYVERNTLTSLRTGRSAPPEWTKMEYFACPHCPLNKNEFNYCPVAVNLRDIISFFSDIPSYEKTRIYVETDERNYYKDTDVQAGVSSLLGLLMVTSGCPYLGRLKPLVRFHLPFSTLDETEYRVFSTYLLAQFIKMNKGDTPDWNFKDLEKLYENLQILNQNVAQKISNLEHQDTLANAVVVLNNFADTISITLGEKNIHKLESYVKELL